MDYFPSRDLTEKYISSSYQDVLQKYLPTGSNLYILDGLGYSILRIPSASIGQTVITSDVTSSMTVASASFSIVVTHYQDSSSFASHSLSSDASDFALVAGNTLYTSSYSVTASYALNAGGGGTSIETGSYYPISVSFSTNSELATNANTSDFALVAGNTLYTASYSITASYALNAGGGNIPIKSGIVSGSIFGMSSLGTLTSSVSFTTPFNDNMYTVGIFGEISARIWLSLSKSAAGFIIDSGDSRTINGTVMWQAIYVGEYNS